MTTPSFKLIDIKTIYTVFAILAITLTNKLYAEDSMLTKKPYFTWRIETNGARYEGKINGILLEEDFKGQMLAFEEPVNQYMRTGTNRISLLLYPRKLEGFGNAKISVSLYVNQDEAPESEKKLIGQIVFSAEDHANGKSIQSSMPAMRLDSTDGFKQTENGDVIIHSAVIEPAKIKPKVLHVYQDIEVKTPFPEWGFFKADPVDFPDAFTDLINNSDYYDKTLLAPLYGEHKKLFEIMSTQDMDKILPLFAERNREYDIALYYPLGTYEGKLRKTLLGDFNNPDTVFKIQGFESAMPTVSDNKQLIRLGGKSLIYFHNEKTSTWSYYKIWYYQKDGQWIISR